MSAELRGQGHPGWSCKTHESCRLSGNAQFTRPVHQERIEVGCSRDSLRSKSVLSYIKMLMGCKHGIGCSIVFGQVPFYLFSFTYPFPLHPSALSHCIVHSVRHIFLLYSIPLSQTIDMGRRTEARKIPQLFLFAHG
jgi:hypothetical protein